jgi:hypothetical protein
MYLSEHKTYQNNVQKKKSDNNTHNDPQHITERTNN